MGKTPIRKRDVYLRFLQIAEAIRGLPGLPPLDPLEERILTFIAATNQASQRLCVRELMAHHPLGAPATIHSRLKSMRSKGWVQLSDTDDSRRKQVELTREAMQHFQRLSQAMLTAAEER